MKLTIESGGDRREYDLTGPKLRAFAHSLEHESHSGAEWDDLTDAETAQLSDLLAGMGIVVEAWASNEGRAA